MRESAGKAVWLWDMRYPAAFSYNPSNSRDSSSQHAQLNMKLAHVVVKFTSSLSSTGTGTLSQIWLPSISEDGSVVLGTQGVPFSVSGTVDLLALFRCISCRFKFTTDVTDPNNMGVVGRVFASGEPEFSHNVQTYNKSVYLRVSDAQRCRVHSTMLLPMYMDPQRDHPFGVFEVCQTEKNVLFPSLVDLFQRCLEDVNLYTVDIEKHSMGIGLRCWPSSVDYTGKDSASVATFAHEAAACTDVETLCSADSLQRLKAGSASGVTDQGGELPGAGSGAKGETMADSEENRADKVAAALPSTSACQLPTPFQDPQLQQGGSLNASQYTSYGVASQKQGGGGGAKSEGMARLVSVGNRLELDLEPLLVTSKGGMGGHSAIEAGKQGSERAPLRLEVGLPAAAAALQRGFGGDKGGFAGPLSGFGLPYGTVPPRGDMVLPASQAGLDAMAWGPGSASDGLAFCEEDDDDPSQPDSTAQEASFNNRVGGGAGKRLSLQELQAQFGVGLREAAANLRICPTTLKRACRRHGITRWPRRQLAKLNRSEGSKSDGSGELPNAKLEGSYRSGFGSSCQQPAVSSAASPCTSAQLGAERRGGVITRSFSAATSAGRATVPDGTSPGILTSLDFPADIQQQPFYLSGNPSSTGILDLFQNIGPSGSAGMVQPAHGAPILHPDDMLW
ncbi:g7329 [Coccomyxa elongata]